MKIVKFLAIFSAGIGFSANAQEIPGALGCVAVNAATGQLVPVRQRIGPSSAWAHSNWDPDGWPTITYGPTYLSLPPFMQTFTSAHECGHLSLQTTNEFAANCYALQNAPLSHSDKVLVAQFHLSIGTIGLQYGGSGPAFWAGTVNMCPGLAP